MAIKTAKKARAATTQKSMAEMTEPELVALYAQNHEVFKESKKVEDALKAEFLRRDKDADVWVGDKVNLSITMSAESRLDTALIRADMSAKWIEKHTKISWKRMFKVIAKI